MFAGKKSAQIREILISESAWEEMTCLFAPSLNHTWDDGYLTADGVGTLALQSYEQIDSEGAILTFSNGNVRAKILPKVQNNLIQFFLWDKGNWHPCSYK